jgi:hypothetical protein
MAKRDISLDSASIFLPRTTEKTMARFEDERDRSERDHGLDVRGQEYRRENERQSGGQGYERRRTPNDGKHACPRIFGLEP